MAFSESWLAQSLKALRLAGLSAKELRAAQWQLFEVDRAGFYGLAAKPEVDEIFDTDRVCDLVSKAKPAESGKIKVGKAVEWLKDEGGAALAKRVSKLSKTRHGRAHPDSSIVKDVQKFVEQCVEQRDSCRSEEIMIVDESHMETIKMNSGIHKESDANPINDTSTLVKRAISVAARIEKQTETKGKGKGYSEGYDEAVAAFREIEKEAKASLRQMPAIHKDGSHVSVLYGHSVQNGAILKLGHGAYEGQCRVLFSKGQETWVDSWRVVC
jgi:hypothetical protein